MRKPPVEVGRWDQNGPARANPQATVQALEALAQLLDNSIPLPGTRIRIGLDSLLGLIPVIGDLIGAALSTYIMAVAAKLGVPRVTLLRMAWNVALDGMLGLVPFAGDIFDFAWKANLRNVALLRDHIADPGAARRGDWVFAFLFLGATLAVLALLAWLGSTLWHWGYSHLA